MSGVRPGVLPEVNIIETKDNVVPISKPKQMSRVRMAELLARARAPRPKRLDQKQAEQHNPFAVYTPPPGVLPAGIKPMAMDDAATQQMINWAVPVTNTYVREGLVFPGYAYLSELTLRPEYRVISQVIATEMTRKWISFQSTASKDETEDKDEGGFGEELEEGEEGLQGQNPGAPDLSDGETTSKEDEEEDITDEIGADADPEATDPTQALVAMQLEKHETNKDKQDQAEVEKEQRAEKLGAKDAKAERIKELTAEFDRLNVRDIFYKLAEFDGWFGRVHLYLDTGDTDNPEELKTDIGDGSIDNEASNAKINESKPIERLAVIEPVWTYPQQYDSRDPLKAEFYNPAMWFVMGKQVHASRLMTFVGRPVSDILKPAYAFGGLSLSQIARPYIDNWLQTRQSVNDIINAFSVMVLMTDLSSRIQASDGTGVPADGSDLLDRVDLFNALRDNLGTFVIDKEGEDFKNVTTPLSNLDSLQAQAQEHMASVSRIPLVKLLGTSPHGLNATAEPELKAFYDTIHAFQEFFFRPNLTKVMHFVMRSIWGEIDEDIVIKFEPLFAMDEKEAAEVRKLEAETDDILVNGCNALHPEEVRKKIANDPESGYDDIDVADAPDEPVDDAPINLHGTAPFGGKGGQGDPAAGGEEPGGEKPPNPFGDSAGIAGDSAGVSRATRISIDSQGFLRVHKDSYGFDAEWKESDHPRVSSGPHAGEFGSGGGGGGSSAQAKPGAPGQAKPISSGQYAGLYETKGANPKENHALTVSKVLGKPAQKGIHYRRLVAALIKEAPGFGGSSAVTLLKQKLGEAMGMTFASLQKAGKTEEAAKVAKQAGKLGLGEAFQKGSGFSFGDPEGIGGQPEPSAPAAPAKKPVTPQLPPPGSQSSGPSAPGQVKPITSPAPPAPQATPSDLEKAKKPSPYYPAPTSAEGKALVKPFNDKYEGKNITDPAQLNQKVADYKAISKQLEAITLKEQAAKEAKAKADAKKEAEALAGTPEDKAHYAVLAGITAGSANHYVKDAKISLKHAGLEGVLSPVEAATVVAYSGSHYRPVNEQLRKGMLTEAQFGYARSLDMALRKMPAYTGTVYRKADLPPVESAKYQPGYIIWERAFTSSSKNQGTWSGSHQYVITSKSGRDIQKLSSHSGEAEVLFPMNSHFKVTKRMGNVIHMEEV